MGLRTQARRWTGAGILALLLCGCATQATAPVLADAAQQAMLLRELGAFTLDGRVAVRAGDEGWQANVRWRQEGEVSSVRLSGPFGAGALQVRYDGEALWLTTSRGQTLRGEEATLALRQQLGFDPPIAELRHWLLGRPAPHAQDAALEASTNGLPATLRQRDWQLAFEEYRAATLRRNVVQMPRRIIATREAVRLRLVVDRWKLGRAR